MGSIHSPQPVLLLVAASSRYVEAFDWGRQQFERTHGALALQSERFEFTETDYYAATMGPDLKKQFWAFADPIDPERIAAVKRQANQWEAEYAALGNHSEPRPLNLDPGYVTLAKLVLASTKDHAHRIYLADGIYAEVTLSYRDKAWRSFDWTFPDYRRNDYHEFFTRCRDLLRGTSRRRS